MAFKIRDLMISVLPTVAADPGGCPNCTGTTGQGCFGATNNGCPNCTGTTPYHGFAVPGCPNCSGTTAQYGCPNCSGTTGGFGCRDYSGTTGNLCAHAAALMACGLCTGVSPLLAEDQRPRALALLRQQLQGLLAEVEAEEQRLAAAAFPQTAEETEALEKKLEEALAEVRSRKAAFGKKKKG